jgi:hypothetical protein
MCVPTPAADGLNIPALTPGPLYVPPAGDAPVNAKAGVIIHVAELEGMILQDRTVCKIITCIATPFIWSLHRIP